MRPTFLVRGSRLFDVDGNPAVLWGENIAYDTLSYNYDGRSYWPTAYPGLGFAAAGVPEALGSSG
jgi:hypothetical protein